MMKKYVLLSLLMLILLPELFSQQEDEAAVEPISAPYFVDGLGYHGIGAFFSPDRDEAVRLAKSDAIKRVFQEIQKDAIFEETFIASWPEFITVENSRVIETEGGGFSATVQVLIDRNAVDLAEPFYQSRAIGLLNQAEDLLSQADESLKEASLQESNLDVPSAIFHYKTTLSLCRRINRLIRPLGDTGLQSDSGNTLFVIGNITAALQAESAESLGRLEEIEGELEKRELTEELDNTYGAFAESIEDIDTVVREYDLLSPFYDLPRSQLETVRIEIEGALALASDLQSNLVVFQQNLPEDSLLYKQRTEMALTDLDVSMNMLVKMQDEVTREIREPRMERQEIARRQAEFNEAVTGAARYVFLHPPTEVLSFRYTIPAEWDGRNPPAGTDKREFRIMAEGTISSGFWIRGTLFEKDIALLTGEMNRPLSSELALGYFGDRIIFGVGFEWDWLRQIQNEKTLNESSVKVILGGVDQERLRANWLLGFQYRVPAFMNPPIIPYHLNLGLDVMIRIEKLFLLEGSISTGTVQNGVSAGSGDLPGQLEYLLNWRGAIALRMPPPFSWGIFHNGSLGAPLAADHSLGATQYTGYWGMFIEYAF
jgi:hypothetical protein